MLPATLSRQFATNWQPIFKFLEPVLQSLPRDNLGITDDDFERVYVECIEFLKGRVSYLWKERSNPKEYTIGTWSNKVSYSSIKKFGTDADKSYLTEPSNRNNNKQKTSRKRSRSANTKYPTRQAKSIRRAREQQAEVTDGNNGGGNNDEDGESFATAFAHVGELTEAMEQRLEEIRQEVVVADEQARRDQETRQIREEGWASRPIPTIRNYRDM